MYNKYALATDSGRSSCCRALLDVANFRSTMALVTALALPVNLALPASIALLAILALLAGPAGAATSPVHLLLVSETREIAASRGGG